eukprot:CAMPEP_0172468582 /NCGR_PEP_ID=MMETSP1065-20121228/61597_1 /TAXON_ID=265537 /ORGANISM="Amphiprora paludosa, Strain CCMP125" /LENGTH=533 /DNA_ID=CAMNT_0013225999 /DNA_START=89 /DNA_END=1690 /DNA_ORIENTATION=-
MTASSSSCWKYEDIDLLVEALFDPQDEDESPASSTSLDSNQKEIEAISPALDSASAAGVPLKKQRISAVSTVATANAKVFPESYEHKQRKSSVPQRTTAAVATPLVPIAPKPSMSQVLSVTSPPRSKALANFLQAVAISSQEHREIQRTKTVALTEMSAKEQLDFRRERNRCLAKQTRRRKKVQEASLQQQFKGLFQEHERLQTIAKQYCSNEGKNMVRKATDSLRRNISRHIWDQVSCTLSVGDEDQSSLSATAPETVANQESTPVCPSSNESSKQESPTVPIITRPAVALHTTRTRKPSESAAKEEEATTMVLLPSPSAPLSTHFDASFVQTPLPNAWSPAVAAVADDKNTPAIRTATYQHSSSNSDDPADAMLLMTILTDGDMGGGPLTDHYDHGLLTDDSTHCACDDAGSTAATTVDNSETSPLASASSLLPPFSSTLASTVVSVGTEEETNDHDTPSRANAMLVMDCYNHKTPWSASLLIEQPSSVAQEESKATTSNQTAAIPVTPESSPAAGVLSGQSFSIPNPLMG